VGPSPAKPGREAGELHQLPALLYNPAFHAVSLHPGVQNDGFWRSTAHGYPFVNILYIKYMTLYITKHTKTSVFLLVFS